MMQHNSSNKKKISLSHYKKKKKFYNGRITSKMEGFHKQYLVLVITRERVFSNMYKAQSDQVCN